MTAARVLTLQEQSTLSALELEAEAAESSRDFRAAAIAWGKGRDICHAAGQKESAALWGGHALKAAGRAFTAAHKAAKAARPAKSPRPSLFGLPVSIR